MIKGDKAVPVFRERMKKLAENYSNYTDFADALGFSQQTVNYYINGKRVPDAANLIIISQKMGVSVDWLLGLSEVESRDPDIEKLRSHNNMVDIFCLEKIIEPLNQAMNELRKLVC